MLLLCELNDECYLLTQYVMTHIMFECFAVPPSPCFLHILLEHSSQLMYGTDLEYGAPQLIMRMTIAFTHGMHLTESPFKN